MKRANKGNNIIFAGRRFGGVWTYYAVVGDKVVTVTGMGVL